MVNEMEKWQRVLLPIIDTLVSIGVLFGLATYTGNYLYAVLGAFVVSAIMYVLPKREYSVRDRVVEGFLLLVLYVLVFVIITYVLHNVLISALVILLLSMSLRVISNYTHKFGNVGGYIIEKVSEYYPSVKAPYRKVPLKERLVNTLFVLLAFIILSEAKLPTIRPDVLERYRIYEYVFGASIGSVLTLGIGPIVMGGLLAMLLSISEPFHIDIKSEEGRKKFMVLRKFLILVMLVYEAVVQTAILSNPDIVSRVLTFVAFAFGGLLIIVMDDYIMKYGILSGTSWFIIASVSRGLTISLFNPLKLPNGIFAGKVFAIIQYIHALIVGDVSTLTMFGDVITSAYVIPIVGTVAMLFILAYLEKSFIEIRIPKYRKQPKTSLLQQSVMPIIFGSFAVTFFQIAFQSLSGFLDVSVVGRFVDYMNTPVGVHSLSNLEWWAVYSAVFGVTGIVFSYFFTRRLETETLRDAIKYAYETGYPGTVSIRKPERFKVLTMRVDLTSTTLPLLSSIVIVILALIGNALGVVAGGSGLILLVMIVENAREQIKDLLVQEKLNTVYETPRKFVIGVIKELLRLS